MALTNILIAAAMFVTLAAAFFFLMAAAVSPASLLGARLRALTGVRIEEKKPKMQERLEQALTPLAKALPASPAELSRMRLMLVQAGFREPRHATIFFGSRVALLAAAVIFVLSTNLFARDAMFAVGIVGLAYTLPTIWLRQKVKARQLAIRLGLPDALDLAVICVEAGLGLDQAVQRVGDEMRHVHKDLSDEFGLVNLEMRAGKPRAEALRNLAVRTGVDDMRALVAVLIQTDRFGTSIATALRVHSDALRTERRQRAEEAAAKTTIKMVPVLVFFVFPSMFFVSLGPAAIQLMRNLLPALK
ncbi:MAG TPA: type II secretion system F family protein [Terriglobales bacterium]|nr:type II secretion system F family protein [Terriglobales bacterium]